MSLTAEICNTYDNQPDALIEILHDVQSAMGYLSADSMRNIAEALNLSRAEVQGVVSFYEDFREEPEAVGTVKLCRGEACQSVGSDQLADDLDKDGVSHHAVFCLGNCALGPAAMVGSDLVGRATSAKLQALSKHQKTEG